VAAALARRTDTIWVDILGGGDEISAVFHLDGPDARNALLLGDLPATGAVNSWTAQTLRLATEVDLALLGVRTEALLWITVQPGALEETARALSVHPQIRFTAATSGPTNLLVAIAAADLNALYAFLTNTIGAFRQITAIDTTPLLATIKRTGLIRRP
jgi:DNA-binding Lrp family transcriptional regulator